MAYNTRTLANLLIGTLSILLLNRIWHWLDGSAWPGNHYINYGSAIAFAAFVVALYVSSRSHRKTLSQLDNYLQHMDKAELQREDLVFRDNSPEVNRLEKTMERILERRRVELERMKQLEDYRKDYLGNVSHELKTPIFNIQGYISTLIDGGLEDPRINRDFLEKADRNVERLVGIVSDLEAITQYEAGQLMLQETHFDLLQLTREVIESLELSAARENISLVLQAPEKPCIVYADKFRIRQVLTNLGTNSIRYGKDGGSTRFRLMPMGERMRVEVADTGLGIPQKDIARIFERFYRVDKSRSRQKGGSGLGLAIVKHIIEAHGESMDVMSTEGAGSVFGFSLPVNGKSE
jgi:two-component system, OmpR family, phosphate regulon sensor histidine kinase PhoR